MSLAQERQGQLVDELVAEALELRPEARSEYLHRACAGDRPLRAEVDSLLAHANDPGILDSTVSLRGLQPNELIDRRWRVVARVGGGGMGDVYEVLDELDGNRPVALKVIKPEAANNSRMIMRFKQEVRIGHDVTHPNVCRVRDLGSARRTWRHGLSVHDHGTAATRPNIGQVVARATGHGGRSTAGGSADRRGPLPPASGRVCPSRSETVEHYGGQPRQWRPDACCDHGSRLGAPSCPRPHDRAVVLSTSWALRNSGIWLRNG